MESAHEHIEIQALLQLIDDPDQEVFDAVADKILGYGKIIIPNLENLWENSMDEIVQQRLEMLIHRVHFRDLQGEFRTWSKASEPKLLEGAYLVSCYQYPELSFDSVLNEIKKIERNIWLELNEYLTPLEKINVINSMFYSYSDMHGNAVTYSKPQQFFINRVLESHRGNTITLGILYQIICSRLDVPVFSVRLPRQFLLGYFESVDPIAALTGSIPKEATVLFFIDPIQGQIYTKKDAELYLKRLGVETKEEFYRPHTERGIIKMLLEELSKCFDNVNNKFKEEELKSLSQLLGNF